MRTPIQQRARLLATLFVLPAFLILFLRLAWLHVVAADDVLERVVPKTPSYSAQARGPILDNSGTALAVSVAEYSAVANASRITDEEKLPTAEKLA
ncbi:MAG TPA: hypothetical protein PKM88_11660, partial [bacterium]|nr:hypothetical protein [bacterium]